MGEFRQLTKTIGARKVLDAIDLHLPKGQITGLFGANGSGKSTLARLLAGLVRPSSGVMDVAEYGRILLVQQDFVMWPHLSVEENVALGMSTRGGLGPMDLLVRFGLAGEAKSPANDLSFGQQQRVCLARALATDANLFLFDESLSGADTGARMSLLRTIAELVAERNATAMWITHDWSEVAAICSHAAVLDAGRLVQEGTPQSIYWEPVSRQVAELTGPLNFVPAADFGRFNTVLAEPLGGTARDLGVRPESLQLVADPNVTGFTLVREWSVLPGAMQEIQCTNELRMRRFTALPFATIPRYGAMRLLRPPCDFLSSL